VALAAELDAARARDEAGAICDRRLLETPPGDARKSLVRVRKRLRAHGPGVVRDRDHEGDELARALDEVEAREAAVGAAMARANAELELGTPRVGDALRDAVKRG